MRVLLDGMQDRFRQAQRGRSTSHDSARRSAPSLWQYDYLALSQLASDVEILAARLPPGQGGLALDVGSSYSPYRALFDSAGYRLSSLDITLANGAELLGSAENIGVSDGCVELVLCTQVLEHCDDPWKAMAEIHRVLRPGGHAIVSVPHVWFYHPHPHDNWRFTQEGLVRLAESAQLEVVELLAQGGTILTLAQIVNFLLYGVAGRAAAPAYACVSLAGLLADRIAPNELFCHNFACLLRRS